MVTNFQAKLEFYSQHKTNFFKKLKQKLTARSINEECEKIKKDIKEMMEMMSFEMSMVAPGISPNTVESSSSPLYPVIETTSIDNWWTSKFGNRPEVGTAEFSSAIESTVKVGNIASSNALINEVSNNKKISFEKLDEVLGEISVPTVLGSLDKNPQLFKNIGECKKLVESILAFIAIPSESLDLGIYYHTFDWFNPQAFLEHPLEVSKLKQELEKLHVLFTKSSLIDLQRWLTGTTRISHRFETCIANIYNIFWTVNKTPVPFASLLKNADKSDLSLEEYKMVQFWIANFDGVIQVLY